MKRRFAAAFIALCLLMGLVGCVPFQVPRTPSGSGVVLDATSRLPVGGARVYFQGDNDAMAVSGPDGYFKISPRYERRWLLPLPYDFAAVPGVMNIEARGYESLRFDQKHDQWPQWNEADKRGGFLWLLTRKKPNHSPEPTLGAVH